MPADEVPQRHVTECTRFHFGCVEATGICNQNSGDLQPGSQPEPDIIGLGDINGPGQLPNRHKKAGLRAPTRLGGFGGRPGPLRPPRMNDFWLRPGPWLRPLSPSLYHLAFSPG